MCLINIMTYKLLFILISKVLRRCVMCRHNADNYHSSRHRWSSTYLVGRCSNQLHVAEV